MKKLKTLFFIIAPLILLSSCRTNVYTGYIGQSVLTEVQLKEANFKVLGSFTGSATAKKSGWSIKDKTGVISAAKMDLLNEAKMAGVELKGARTLINITTDIIENSGRITCTMSAEVIEFE